MKKKKSKFWLFLFSLCPGAGHMYLGFMKMGLSFLLGFMLSIVVVDLTSLDVLAVISVVIYIYALFHANNIGALDDERFYALEDVYLLGFDNFKGMEIHLNRKSRGIAAAVLIVIGISKLWDVGFGVLWHYVGGENNPAMRFLFYTVRDVMPRVLMAIAIIWFGIYLLRGRKVTENEAAQESMPRIGKNEQQSQANAENRQSGQNQQDAQNEQQN